MVLETYQDGVQVLFLGEALVALYSSLARKQDIPRVRGLAVHHPKTRAQNGHYGDPGGSDCFDIVRVSKRSFILRAIQYSTLVTGQGQMVRL